MPLDEIESFTVTDPTEQRLLDAVAASPADATMRSVYADWLEGAGCSTQAELLRIQLAIADARDATPAAFARLAELAARLPPGWRARVAIAFVEGCPVELAQRELVVLTIEDGTRRLVFDRLPITIGAAPSKDVVIAGVADHLARLSPRHVTARAIRGDFLLEVRAPELHVNGQPFEVTEGVSFGDTISMGERRIITIHKATADDRPAVATTEATRRAMELACPQRWDRLTPTAHAGIRKCDACRHDVHYCTTLAQAQKRVLQGACVAVDVCNPRQLRDLDASLLLFRRPPPEPDDFIAEEPTHPR